MKKILFEVTEQMFRQIDDAMVRDGFPTRAEFLRFLIVTYCKQNEANSKKEDNLDHDEADETEELDLEFGIPMSVIKKIEVEAKRLGENERRLQS